MATPQEQIEVTVIKNAKSVKMPVTKVAYDRAKKHFSAEGWIECSDKEKEAFFKNRITAVDDGKKPKAKAKKADAVKEAPAPKDTGEKK